MEGKVKMIQVREARTDGAADDLLVWVNPMFVISVRPVISAYGLSPRPNIKSEIKCIGGCIYSSEAPDELIVKIGC